MTARNLPYGWTDNDELYLAEWNKQVTRALDLFPSGYKVVAKLNGVEWLDGNEVV